MDETLLHQAEQHTWSLIRRAETHFGIVCRLSGIHFDLRGKSAGMVVFPSWSKPYIRYNPELLRHNKESFLSQTPPHEVAHLVARQLHGNGIRPHGREWREIMDFFGAAPLRCHNYTMEHVKSRKMRLFPYRCACQQHQLTAIRHHRILKGQTYLCRHCGKSLKAETT